MQNRKKILAIFVAVCMLIMTVGMSVYATEFTPDKATEEVTLIVDENGNVILNPLIEPRYSTFKEFTSGVFTGTQGYSFSLERSCKLKMMWAGKYMDGSSGTMSFTLFGPNTYQEHSMPMDGTARAIEFDGNWLTGTLPAGNYEIQLFPNDVTKEYGSAGSVYTLDY